MSYEDEHMWVYSDEDNVPMEEESDDYLNEVAEEEVFENNDKNENYIFKIEKIWNKKY
jgi:hypothetical protein